MSLKLPDNPYKDDDDNVLKRRLLGAAVLIALAVIILPLLLDGSGSESRFRRVEQLRQEPPRIIDAGTQVSIPDKAEISRPEAPTLGGSETPSTEPQSQPATAAPSTQDESQPEQASGSQQPEGNTNAALQSVPADTGQPNLQASQQASQQAVPHPSHVAPAVEDTRSNDDQIVDSVAWIVQAGSYVDEGNALALRDQLRSAGFPAFASHATNAGKSVFRVKVGPVNSRKEAASVQKQVETLTGQSTLIRKYP